MALEQEVECFEKQRERWAAEQHGKFALVHNLTVHGFFETPLDAYTEAIKNKFQPGDFLIQRCVLKEEEDIPVFHSRVG